MAFNPSWRKTKKVSKARGGPIAKMGKKKFLAEYKRKNPHRGGYAVYPGGHAEETLAKAKRLAKRISEESGSAFIDRVSDGKRLYTYRNGVPHKGNPHVYDSAGKYVGKFKRKAAKIVARVVEGTVGKPKSNPIPRGQALAFKTKTDAKKFIKKHRVKGYRFNLKQARG